MNKIPTISECYAHFYPNERGAPRPSSINETKPSKTLINFKYSLINLKSFKFFIPVVCFSGQNIRGVCHGDSGGPFLWEDKSDNNKAYVFGIILTPGKVCTRKWNHKFLPATSIWIPDVHDWIMASAGPELLECSP